MKKRYYICLIVTALAALSCHKDRTEVLGRDGICFSPKEVSETKALLDNSGLNATDNRIRVKDVLTGFTGSASWMSGNYYIDEDIVYGSPVWDYTSGRSYPWTADGTHEFFGWLSYDAVLDKTEVQFCNASYNGSTRVLSIPLLEMNTDTPQFDFLYSDVETVASSAHPSAPIDLQLHHLFTALSLSVINTSGNTILLKSVTITGMQNKRSATISFTSATPAVATSGSVSTDLELFSSNDANGDTYIHEDLEKTLTGFYLMWPQTYGEIAGLEKDGAQLVTPVDPIKIHVVYHVRDSHDVTSDELTADVVLKEQNLFKNDMLGMDAGTKYTFLLQFKKSTLDVVTRALPWEYEEFDWNYADHSISARAGMFKDGVLAFYRGTGASAVPPTADEWSAKTMRFTTHDEIMTGRFYIEAPTSGRWSVRPFPESAAQYFIVEPTSGDIDVMTENGLCEFTVDVNPALNPASTQTLYFDVSIFYNGEWHDANSEFNRKNIKLVLDAN